MPAPKLAIAGVPQPQKKKPAAPIFPVLFTIVADGRLPGNCNLLHIRAKFSNELQWHRNVLPQRADAGRNRGARPNKYITQELVDLCKPQAVPLALAMQELREWLQRFNGKVVIAGSAVTFWHLCAAMQQVLPKGAAMPWSMQCLDLASYAAGTKGKPTALARLREKTPEAAIAERQALLALGRPPVVMGVEW